MCIILIICNLFGIISFNIYFLLSIAAFMTDVEKKNLFYIAKREANVLATLNTKLLPSEQIGFYTKLDLTSAVVELGID